MGMRAAAEKKREECEACEKEFANLQTRSPVANRASGRQKRKRGRRRGKEGGDPTFLLSLALHTDVSSSSYDDEREREGEAKIKRAE